MILATAFNLAALAQIDWTISNPNLTGAAYGNGTYVLVEQTGWIWTSSDLSNWTRRLSPVRADLNALAFGNGVFVAVATSGAQTYALRSTNGLDWAWQPLVNEANPFYAASMNVVFVNGQFVATGGFVNVNGAFGGILTSPDGQQWQAPFVAAPAAGLSIGPALYGVAYGNGLYMAVGAWQMFGPPYTVLSRVVTSTDAQTWSVTDGPTTGILSDVAFGAGVFVAVGGASLETFVDGHWQAGRDASSLHSIVYGNGRFVAVGDGGSVRTSEDGLTWTNRISGTSATLRRVTLDRNGFLAVGDSGTLLHSVDGTAWTVVQSSYIFGGFGGMACGGGQFVASSYNKMLHSDNGLSWSQTVVSTNALFLHQVAYGAGKFIVIGRFADELAPQPAIMFSSADGTSWHTPSLPTSQELTTVTYANGLFLAGGAKGPIMTSPDGEHWTIRNQEPRKWMGIAYGNGVYLAIENQPFTSSMVATSPDAVSWQLQRASIPIGPGAVAFGRGLFVAAAGNIYHSTDGVNWRQSLASDSYTALLYTNGTFVAVGVGAIATSLDGTTWTSRPATFTLNHWYDGPVSITYGNGTYLTMCFSGWVGAGGELHVSPAVPFLDLSGHNGQINASSGALDAFSLQASSDLSHWTTVTNVSKATVDSPLSDPGAASTPIRFYRLQGP